MNTLKKLDPARTARKLARRLAAGKRVQKPQSRIPQLRACVGAKPRQPTIITRKLARSLAFLENTGVASFLACNLAIPRHAETCDEAPSPARATGRGIN